MGKPSSGGVGRSGRGRSTPVPTEATRRIEYKGRSGRSVTEDVTAREWKKGGQHRVYVNYQKRMYWDVNAQEWNRKFPGGTTAQKSIESTFSDMLRK